MKQQSTNDPRAAERAPKAPPSGPVYRIRAGGAGWQVHDRTGAVVSEPMRTQADAVAHAKELARRDGSAQVIVHAESGAVMSEFFYQRDERPALAYDDESPMTAATHVVHTQPKK